MQLNGYETLKRLRQLLLLLKLYCDQMKYLFLNNNAHIALSKEK